MRAISYGNSYEIFDDSLKTYEKLPVQNYIVRFSQTKGFYLEKYSDIEIKESKIYGVHLEKIDKVLRSFDTFQRNLGVILSGDKGIGKSLFAKLLCIKARAKVYPVVVVDRFIPGIASYLESIEQEVVVLFDEFDKTFGDIRSRDGDVCPQASMLSLFDGISVGKKLFVITCNEVRQLNDYLINRPGRFHYHFRFEYPSPEEIREYLKDKINRKYYGEIDNVIAFSKKINLNYDCLRAIAFEIQSGSSFREAISDLNIVNIESMRYDVVLHFENGMTLSSGSTYINLFDQGQKRIYLYDDKGDNPAEVLFNAKHCVFDGKMMTNVVHAQNLNLRYYEEEENSDIVKQLKSTKPKYLTVSRVYAQNIHYAV